MPLWRILDLMPNKPAFDLASVAIKDQYEKQTQTVQNALDRHEEMDSPGKRGREGCFYFATGMLQKNKDCDFLTRIRFFRDDQFRKIELPLSNVYAARRCRFEYSILFTQGYGTRMGYTSGDLDHSSTSTQCVPFHVLAQLSTHPWYQGRRRNETRKVLFQGRQLCSHGRHGKEQQN